MNIRAPETTSPTTERSSGFINTLAGFKKLRSSVFAAIALSGVLGGCNGEITSKGSPDLGSLTMPTDGGTTDAAPRDLNTLQDFRIAPDLADLSMGGKEQPDLMCAPDEDMGGKGGGWNPNCGGGKETIDMAM